MPGRGSGIFEVHIIGKKYQNQNQSQKATLDLTAGGLLFLSLFSVDARGPGERD